MSRSGIGVWVILVAGLAAVATGVPAFGAFLTAVGVGAAVWRWPDRLLEVTAFAVLAVRPSLDMFSERRFGLSEYTVNPDVVFGVAILWIAIVAAARRGRDGREPWPSAALLRTHIWLFAAYGIAFVSGARLYGGSGAITGARELVRVASVVAAFLIVAWWAEAEPVRYWRGWAYLVAGLVVPIAMALSQWATGYGKPEDQGLNRLYGTFSHPNSLGQYLVPFILLAVGGLPNARGVRWLARLACAVGLTVLLALTYSRTPMLVLATGLAVLPFLHSRRFGWAGLLRSVLLVAVTAGLAWWLAGDLVERRFVDLSLNAAVLQATTVGVSQDSFTWRLVNWAGLISMGLQHPLVGHGAGMTLVLNPLRDPSNDVPFNAHDDFVRFFFEGGFLGLACYVIYGLLMCRWVLARARVGALERAAGAYAVAGAWIAMFFLTGGATELSLQTAGLCGLYGMAGLLLAPEAPVPSLPETVASVP